MQLNKLASKPQLIKFTLDDADLVEQYGEPIEFWSWDRQPLDIFMRLASASTNNSSSMMEIVTKLILDEQGQQIITAENMLPSNVLIRVIGKITEKLGN
jgi:hypothetical protein